jgi:ABC-type multidrug transport system fused ATPase/permease subunit
MRQRKPAAARDRETLTRFVRLLKPERLRLTEVGLLAALSVGFSLVGPVLLGTATNLIFDGVVSQRFPAGLTAAQVIAGLRAHGQGHLADMFSAMDITPGTGIDLPRLGAVLGLAALMYALSAGFGWAQGYVMAGIAQRAVFGLRQTAEEKLARLPLSHFDRHPHGDTISRVTNDIDNITTTLNEVPSPLLTTVLTVAGVLGLMFWISPLLAAVSLVTVPLVTVLVSVIARRARTHFIAQWTSTGQLNGLVEETHTGHDLVLAFGRQQPLVEEFGRQNEQLCESSFRAQFVSGIVLPAVQFVGNLNYVAVVALGGFQVATGVLSFGAVQAFIQYTRRFTIPLAQLAGQVNILQSGLASAQRVFDFLDAAEEASDTALAAAAPSQRAPTGLADAAPAPAVLARKVELRRVSFRYTPDQPLIDDFTLDVVPGQTVAIVGATGAGKTTLVNLLMRFYEIDSGQILLDGVDYRELSRDQVRRCFSMVLQDTWLFGAAIRDNIAYGREGASEQEIRAAARAAHVDDFVAALPDGYGTVLGGDASGISAGQKQLLTIARAFLADPGILILDEATSNVDTRTEVMIQDAMTRLRSGRTSFVIAHRLSTIRNADTIVVMDCGRIAEQGTHQELLDRHGLYHYLYNSQFAELTLSGPIQSLSTRRGAGMDNPISWRVLSEGTGNDIVLAVDFDATGRPEARFADLAKIIGSPLTIWETVPQRVSAEPGTLGETFVSAWLAEVRASGRRVSVVTGFCLGSVYAGALAERIADWQAPPELVLFDPELSAPVAVQTWFGKAVDALSALVGEQVAAEAKAAAAAAAAAYSGMPAFCRQIVDIYQDAARPAFQRMGLDERRAAEYIGMFSAFIAFIGGAAGIDPLRAWETATAISSCSPGHGLSAVRAASPGLSVALGQEIHVGAEHHDLLRDPAAARAFAGAFAQARPN